MSKRGGLGRGLSALIPGAPEAVTRMVMSRIEAAMLLRGASAQRLRADAVAPGKRKPTRFHRASWQPSLRLNVARICFPRKLPVTSAT